MSIRPSMWPMIWPSPCSPCVQIVREFGIPADDVFVTPLGVDADWFGAARSFDDMGNRAVPVRYVLAVGTRPYRPEHVPFDGDCVLDSDEILDLKRLPRHLTVVGAGVIGVEYATIFSALDVRVTL